MVDADGTATVLERVGPTYPNGILVEPDGGVVWDESYTREVRRRRPDGSIELLTTLPENRVADGMKRDRAGRIYIAGVTSGGIDVLEADGTVAGFIELGGEPLNCVFEGADLYVADFGEDNTVTGEPDLQTGRLLRVSVGEQGAPVHRGQIGGSG
jgi:sugar lactone lactonase YvrE